MLSELEGAVLGLLARQGRLSAYAIRKEFERSPTSNWSASAGAIYPLVKRLIKRELIEEAPVEGDGRKTRRLAITGAGHRALGAWVGSEDPAIFGPSADPLRARGFALLILSPAEQHQRLSMWRTNTASKLQALHEERAEDDEARSTGLDLVNYGAIKELEARLNWIDAWLERLDQA